MGRSMRWCFFLLWAQGLRQASQAVIGGNMAGRILTTGNISAEEGDSVTFNCHLFYTNGNVTQVQWELQDQLLAIYNPEQGWYIPDRFRNRVTTGHNMDITLQSLTKNDTGEYFCKFYTYPDGLYKEKFFLEVLQNSVPRYNTMLQMPLLGTLVTLLTVICIVVVVVVVQIIKNKSLKKHSEVNDLRRTTSEQEHWRPSSPSIPGNCAPDGFCREQGEEDYAESHDYLNVLSYRSLGSFSFLAETS